MNNIRQLRKTQMLTQAQLAKQIIVSQSTIAMWETGKSTPRTNKLPQLDKIFGCSIDDLFGDDNKQNPVDGGSG